jgi:D-aminoacyl-tRNA deacylase
MNIESFLLGMDSWIPLDLDCPICLKFNGLTRAYVSGRFRLIEISGHHIYQDGIDKKLEACGLPAQNLIVASKHKSDDGRSVLTAHFTGNPEDAKFGGKERTLSIAYASALKPVLMQLTKYSGEIGYEVSMEATHHGPTEVDIPMIYVEIGSGPAQWEDPRAGEAVAKAILGFRPENHPVALGFGGGHYAVRQSAILLNHRVTFGHNFPSYRLDSLDEALFVQAVEKSGADFVYMDRKSMSVARKTRIGGFAEKHGLPVLRESAIRNMDDVPWPFFRHVFAEAGKLEPDSIPHFSPALKVFPEKDPGILPGQLSSLKVDARLIHLAWKSNAGFLLERLDTLPLIWLEKDNGTLSGFFFSGNSDAEQVLDTIVNECIKILKEHYEIEYEKGDSVLRLSEKRFNPFLAEELGVPRGPLYGKLSGGTPVEVDGKLISPEMVHETVTKELMLDSRII